MDLYLRFGGGGPHWRRDVVGVVAGVVRFRRDEGRVRGYIGKVGAPGLAKLRVDIVDRAVGEEGGVTVGVREDRRRIAVALVLRARIVGNGEEYIQMPLRHLVALAFEVGEPGAHIVVQPAGQRHAGQHPFIVVKDRVAMVPTARVWGDVGIAEQRWFVAQFAQFQGDVGEARVQWRAVPDGAMIVLVEAGQQAGAGGAARRRHAVCHQKDILDCAHTARTLRDW